MMLHMPYMKKTNDEFINWILTQHNGLDYGSEPSFLESCMLEDRCQPAQWVWTVEGRRAVLELVRCSVADADLWCAVRDSKRWVPGVGMFELKSYIGKYQRMYGA